VSIILLKAILTTNHNVSEKAPISYQTGKKSSVLKPPVLSVVNDHLNAYPVPSNLNYSWGQAFFPESYLQSQGKGLHDWCS
jgi:hypothetical protein